MARSKNFKVIIWLIGCLLGIVSMILLGGITRLTNSGLSIVEWQPISGAIPPLTALEWEAEFSKYQQSPEYLQINSSIDLSVFKSIFLIEYSHRLLARIIGLSIIIPFCIFFYQEYIKARHSIPYFILIALLGIQGTIGCLMVKSGLKDQPQVSHYLLALHLFLGCLMYSIILWQLLHNLARVTNSALMKMNRQAILLILLVYIQIIFGAFTAGLDAVKIYNTFPLMGLTMIPPELYELPLTMFMQDATAVQFLHRNLAYIITIVALVLSYNLSNSNTKVLRWLGSILVFLVIGQVILGIFTLLYQGPILLSLLHQGGAIALLTALIVILYYSRITLVQ